MSQGQEDEYFRKIDQENIEKLRRQRQLEALRREEREGIAAVLHTSEEVAQEALELGFDRETAVLLPLIPLLAVAWADGKITAAEDEAVTEIALNRGIALNTPAYNFLKELLAKKPSDLFFERTMRVIVHLVQADPTSWVKKSLPELCIEVAEASGGFFGFGNRVSAEERALIEELAEKLGVTDRVADQLPRLEEPDTL
jgi:tellurite resistance protein